jgi:dipeptidyl aminopeptidase/acylaminoacyl peptidase
MNVYRPLTRERRPVIVSYHGGPAGTASLCWNPMASFFLLQGYAWVAPNVRGSSGFGRAFEMADNGRQRVAALGDVDATAEWVAAQPWADAQRLVVLGGSYGGYTTLMALIRKPELWRAGVDQFGVVDWRTALRVTSGVIRDIFRVEVGELGRDDAFLEEISPITRIERIKRPLFVYAGANDPRVPRSESDQVVTAVRKHGVPCEYMVKDDEGHSLARRPNQIELYSRVARFLEKALRGSVATK